MKDTKEEQGLFSCLSCFSWLAVVFLRGFVVKGEPPAARQLVLPALTKVTNCQDDSPGTGEQVPQNFQFHSNRSLESRLPSDKACADLEMSRHLRRIGYEEVFDYSGA